MSKTFAFFSVAALVLASSTVNGDLVLTFVPSSSSVQVGSSITVDIVLTQDDTSPANSLLDDDGLTAFSVPFNFSGSDFSVTSFAVAPGFTDTSSTSTVLQGFSFSPVTGTPRTLGTYTLTADSVSITPTTFTTSNTGVTNFSFNSGTDDDVNIFASFSSPVGGISAVPEPSSFLFIGLVGTVFSGLRWVRTRETC